jgi:transcriptional regulator with XRE-family HTH domain
MFLTIEEIADKLGVSRIAVLKKRQILARYEAKKASFGGRPRKYYSAEILREFGLKPDKIIMTPEPEDEPARELRRKRARNSSIGKPRVITEELEARLKSLALRTYLEQSRRDNIFRCVEAAVAELWRFIEKEAPHHTPQSFSLYFYMHRVMRKTNHFLGYAHSENWYLRWDEAHKKNKFNASLPTNRWDYLSLFEDAGLIGEGYGAGLIWSIDATQFNAWIDDGGKPRAMSFMMVLDGVTAMPLYMEWLEKGETIEDTARILWNCVQIHGKPPLGIVFDNGAAFRSKEIQALVRSWYTPAELYEMENNEFRKKLFWGQTSPCIYPIAKIPRYPIKAQHERWFEMFDRFCYEELAGSYIGTRDSRAVEHELGSTPTKAVSMRYAKEVVFAGFLNWIYNKEIWQRQPKLSHLRAKGLEDNLANIWRYYGGRVAKGNLQLPEDTQKVVEPHQKHSELPGNAIYYALYATGIKHEVKANLGSVVVTEAGRTYNFQSEWLDLSLVGKKVKVAIHENKGIIMKEWQPNDPDPRTPEPDSLWFVGVAHDAFIRTVADLENRRISTNIRKKLNKQVKESTSQLIGGRLEIRNKLEVQTQITQGLSWQSTQDNLINPPLEDTEQSEEDELDKLINLF